MQVGLITTGRMEFVGLPQALGGLFPQHEFYSVPLIPGSEDPFPGFTSARLPISAPVADTALDKLIQAMAAHLVPGRRGHPPDLLFLVDDLELSNDDQPHVVVDEVRKAVVLHLGTLEQPLAGRVADAFRDRASFHLAVPMAESWLFADPAGPANAGAPANHLPARLRAGVDPELFETDDAAYDADDGSACTRWSRLSESQQKRKRKTEKPEWLKEHRQRRPKSYIAWLARDCAAKKCSTYSEVGRPATAPSGATALAALNWSAALAQPEHLTFLRSLVFDLADALGLPVPAAMQGQTASHTCRHSLPADPVLRNM